MEEYKKKLDEKYSIKEFADIFKNFNFIDPRTSNIIPIIYWPKGEE